MLNLCAYVYVHFSQDTARHFYQILIGVHGPWQDANGESKPAWSRSFQQSGKRERAPGSVPIGSFCGSACVMKYNVEINCVHL